jgi:hypothetical protein
VPAIAAELEKKYHISHSSQGFVSSCVELVVDIYLQSPSGEGSLALGISALSSSLAMDYSPCVYDSMLLIRPTCSFREGLSLNNIPSSNSSYYEQLGKTSLIFGLGQMVGIAYTKKKASTLDKYEMNTKENYLVLLAGSWQQHLY